MSKIKETVTAVSAGNEPGAVRIKREEQERMPEWYFITVVKCVIALAAIASMTLVVIFAEIWKVLALAVFGIFFSLIYFGSKN